jgi:GTP-binding protein LepA
MVFSGIYPVDSEQYPELREALDKLHLNDSSISYEPETSQALGFGFRCGYLGLLHMEIVKERLEREFSLELIATAPSVVYRIHLKDGSVHEIENPSRFPDPVKLDFIEEPMIRAVIYSPVEYMGALLKICQDRRGKQVKIEYISGNRAMISYDLPLNEVVFGFFDQVKSVSRGYASFEYDLWGYERSDLVKMDILLNGDPVDALSIIVNRAKAFARGRELCKKLKENISRQMYQVAIQAAIGGKIIARETVGAMRKNVTAKCYGGDITRKRKLLEKQKEGKKRMKQMGKVSVSQEAFLALLKLDE